MKRHRIPSPVSRRQALKAGLSTTASLAALAAARHRIHADDGDPFDPGGRVRVDYDETVSFNALYENPPLLGRLEAWSQRVVNTAGDQDDLAYTVHYSDVLPIYGAVHADPRPGFEHNDIWYDVGDGFIHSSWIVPCREIYNEPEDVPFEGFWGEITVPTSWQHWTPELNSRRYFDLAYGAVFRVVDRVQDVEGRDWYRLRDELDPDTPWFVQASHVRRIRDSEFFPLSPAVPPDQKLIRVNLTDQMLTCYEYDRRVFATRVSTGATFVAPDGEQLRYGTPTGTHRVVGKMPSRHMMGGEEEKGDDYDLPGVPWCTYITGGGVAIHGTYWHNDFGRKRSHGCINVTSDAAKWIYRWTLPWEPPDFMTLWVGRDKWAEATRVIVEF